MYDLAVIGGGPGGYTAAIRGAQSGLKVLLAEKAALGGVCLNKGCIPAKCFVHDTRLLDSVKQSPVLEGAHGVSIALEKMVARKNKVVKTLVDGLGTIIRSHGIETARGGAELTGAKSVRIVDPEGLSREIRAENIVIATGSRPAVPPFIKVDGEIIQTTDEALNPLEIPASLVIIGGGVIGMEFASIYRSLGSDVTIIELLPDILITEDSDVRRVMRLLLTQSGVSLHLKSSVKAVSVRNGRAGIDFEDEAGKPRRAVADRVLVATGRAPALDGIDAAKLGLALDGGFIKVNWKLETSLRGVYAIGDVIGGMMLAHKASAEAEAAVENIQGGSRRVKTEMIPRCVWSFSEIGSIGLTEEQARSAGRPVKIGKFPYPSNGHAMAIGATDGFVKIVGDAENGAILGVHILGAHATELIGETVVAKTMEAAVEDLAEAVHPHPTLSEAVMEAAMEWNKLAVHAPKND